MHSSTKEHRFNTAPLILFGPQLPRVSQKQLSDLRASILADPKCKFLVSAIAELPSLWPVLQQSIPDLARTQGENRLQELKTWMDTGVFPDLDSKESLILAPLTVITHIVEFLALGREGEVQGFCIGFLSAVAASSKIKEDFERNSSTALRLAVCVGAIIDLDELMIHEELGNSSCCSVRWKTDQEKAHFEKTLAASPHAYVSCVTDFDRVTVTVLQQEADSFVSTLSNGGLTAQWVGMRGRYHLPTRIEPVKQIKALCDMDKRFQFLAIDALKSQLRSNIDAMLITDEAVHDVALDSILTNQSRWFQTVQASMAAMDVEEIEIVPIGAKGSIPHSLTAKLNGAVFPPALPQATISGQNSVSSASVPEQQARTEMQPSIAVIGMGCRFPMADSLAEFWDLINSGGCAAGSVPKDRFELSDLWREPKGPFWGNFIRSPDAFDHRFFKISSREAKSMDPQQRLLLQVAYEAMESAGYSHQSQNQDANIGCYVGVGSVDYEANIASENATAYSATGTLRAFISGKVSHYFGWKGPSITFDTACSSSAVAIHSACKALITNECSMAIAGGVNVITSPALYQNLAAASFLSPKGASRAFDAGASGYCRGEGAGVVVLKLLSRAIADHDDILGVIAGSAVNQGSNCTPITVPHSDSQSSLYQHVLSLANVLPSEVTYVEAHGTGTPVGDPIECESIRRTLGGPKRSEELFIGSVKDNIGHAEGASGVAGLLKALLMIQHQTIPKQANFVSLNPRIPPLATDRMAIAKKSQRWTSSKKTIIINNYGAAGSNAALLLQEYRSSDIEKDKASSIDLHQPEVPILLSAKSPHSLKAYCAALNSFITKSQGNCAPDMVSDIAYNLSRRQNREHAYSCSFLTSSEKRLSAQLREVKPGEFKKLPDQPKPIVLCFGGQTGRQIQLSEDVFNDSRLLRIHLIQCDSICRNLGLQSLFPRIFDKSPVEDLVHLHSMLFCLQYAVAKAWLDSGLKVATLIGHSFGQLTALCVADCLSLEDGIRLVSERARLIEEKWPGGAGIMLSIEGDMQAVEGLLELTKKTQPSFPEVACYNGPRNIVLAGTEASIEAAEDAILSGGLQSRLKVARLGNTHAYHSKLAESILPDLENFMDSVQLTEPSIALETCSAGQSWEKITAGRIVEHTRLPVYFSEAVERIAGRFKSSIWLEAGSASPIIAMVKRVLKASPDVQHTFVPLDLGLTTGQNSLAKASCTLWEAGSKAAFWPFQIPENNRKYKWLCLPPYQFERTRHWTELNLKAGSIKSDLIETVHQQPELLELFLKNDGKNQMLFSVDTTNRFFSLGVRGHAVLGQSLSPASMYCELVLRAVRIIAGTASSAKVPRIWRVDMQSPLGPRPSGRLFVTLSGGTGDVWSFTVFTGSEDGASVLTTHASGMIGLLDPGSVASAFQSLKKLVANSKCDEIITSPDANGLSGESVYKLFGRTVDYADYYRGVQKVFAKNHEVTGYVYVPENQPPELEPGCCDPVAIDNFLQVAGIHVNCLSKCADNEVFVCTMVGGLSLSERFTKKSADERRWTVYSNFEQRSKKQVTNNIFVIDPTSRDVVVTITGVEFTAVPLKSLTRALSKLNDAVQALAPKRAATIETSSSMPVAPQDGITHHFPVDEPAATRTQIDHGTEPLKMVQEMLSDILGIPADDILPSSSFTDLGIDSLMVTEVASEIKQRFGVPLTANDFQDLTDVQSLCYLLQPFILDENVAATPPSSESASSEVDGDAISGTRQNPAAKDDEGLALISQECLAKSKRTYDSVAAEAGLTGFYSSVYPAQAQLVVAYVVEAFAALGCPLATLNAGQQVLAVPHSEKHKKAMNQYFKILQEANIIDGKAGSFYRTETNLDLLPTSVLQSALVEKFPKHSSEHKLLHTTGSKLADCLTDSVDPLSLLFRDAKARSLLEDVYTNAPMFKAGTIFLAKYLVNILRQYRGEREIKILELGGGTGGTTSYLIDQLATSGQRFEYTFTDLSPSLVTAAKKKFSKYNFVKFSTMDIETTPPDHLLGCYDIVVSTNCIHATRNLQRSCTNIRSLLRSTGILCLVELTRNLYWFDLVFGLLEGWWLFDDGREHALASETLWQKNLLASGFQWVDWTEDDSEESSILRVIAASPTKSSVSAPPNHANGVSNGTSSGLKTQETVIMKKEGELELLADIYYPKEIEDSNRKRPIALMIHGGGHIMLSRRDIRPKQTSILIDAGFLPVSIDYRLCPELSLLEGPMKDVCDALNWARNTLPQLQLQRNDIKIDGEKVVAIGWSTGGHLALTLGWTATTAGIQAPQATLSFYCPTDYEDEFWRHSNVPHGSESAIADELDKDMWEAVSNEPITAYNVPQGTKAIGGWMATTDPRSRIALHMNWKGQTLPVLLHGSNHERASTEGSKKNPELTTPTVQEIQSISPLAHIRNHRYKTPTFLIHGTLDDLIPLQQAQRTYEALVDEGVHAEMRVVEGGVHLFDIYEGFMRENEEATMAVREGYRFLCEAVGLH